MSPEEGSGERSVLQVFPAVEPYYSESEQWEKMPVNVVHTTGLGFRLEVGPYELGIRDRRILEEALVATALAEKEAGILPVRITDSPSTFLNDGGHPQAQGRVEGAPKTSGAAAPPAAAPDAPPANRAFRINRRSSNSMRVDALHVRFEPEHVVFTKTKPDGAEFIVEAILNTAIKDLIEVTTHDE